MVINMNKENIVEFRDVSIAYPLKKFTLQAVTNASLPLKKGMITALVGESGSGKTTLASSLIQCISEPGKVVGGDIVFNDNGNEIFINKLKDRELRKFRWEKVSMVFQAAQSALNPVMKVKDHFIETMNQHGMKKVPMEEKEVKIKKLLNFVKLDVDRVMDSYPHELSGGMKQRVMIAFALLLDPEVIILDEPTTALDVITQYFIFTLLKKINKEMGISMLLMTHDISVVAKFADYVAVMYGGRIMEYGDVHYIFKNRYHPYTRGLIGATPSILGSTKDIEAIEGNPPNLLDLPKGCIFNPRCKYCQKICQEQEPESLSIDNMSKGKCHFYKEI